MNLRLSHICISALLLATSLQVSAQKQKAKAEVAVPDFAAADSARMATEAAKTSVDSAITAKDSMNLAKLNSSLRPMQKKKRDWATWRPDAKRAMWLALVLPGAGQIYNRKYWKLPIIYGGFAGCAYALTWNGKMYKDYMQAYKDASKGNWDASSITDLLPPGYIDRVSQTQIVETLRKRKDTYRRYRDLSIFAFIGVYLISVIDAYVDAELSNFDITPDLSMRIEPAVINNPYSSGTSNKSVGLQCSFRF